MSQSAPPKCDKEPVLEGVEGSDHGASRRLGRVCAAGPSRLTLKDGGSTRDPMTMEPP